MFLELALGSLLALCLGTAKSRKLSLLFCRFLFAWGMLFFERRIWTKLLGLPGPLPRDLDEVTADRLDGILKAHGVITEHEQVIKVVKLQPITSEPDKQLTAGSIRVFVQPPTTTTTAGEVRELALFCKFQTGRGMPLFLQAVRWAAEYDVAREVDFYNKIQPKLDPKQVKTSRPILAMKSPLLNYVFVILEHLDLGQSSHHRVVNDYEGATVSEVQAMLVSAAHLHQAFPVDAPEVAWIPAKRELEFAKWVESFSPPRETRAFSPKIWQALREYFTSKPVTLVHGDFRPGNMIFQGSDRDNVEGVLVSDWEATNVGPSLWDFTYLTTLGWSAKARRAHQSQQLAQYLANLAPHQQQAAKGGEEDLVLLVLLLGFVSRTIRVNKFWSNQGNTTKDQGCWLIRVCLALGDVNAKQAASLLPGVDESDIAALQAQALRETQDLFAGREPLKRWEEI
ncbi:hypothetical protein BASA81_012833 [Batrachochytrium salamandrivorans]|nr:hypothetical protein BASA81_012833 [Batrachochytrium salamandrivorans]